jgi:sarcosine oxidase subunit beta
MRETSGGVVAKSDRVIVLGAGIIGASCAYHLAARGQHVTVLEKFDAPAEGSTGRSFASVRAQWSDDLNVTISWQSIQTYRDFEKLHNVDVGYRPTGYMYLVPEQDWTTQLGYVAVQQENGVPVETISFQEAQLKTPFIQDGLGGVTWGSADGVVDPYIATTAYVAMAKTLGVTFHMKTEVFEITRTEAGWRVRAGDSVYEADFIVNCAGGWSNQTGQLAGFDIPVQHVRRNIYSTAPNSTPVHPMTIDLGSGIFLRSEGERLLFGLARADEPAGYNTSVDWDWMETVLETAGQRFPWLLDTPLDPSGAWAGTYEVTPDHFPILGALPEEPNWINACGFSGHGVMQAPYIGKLIAEELCDGKSHSIDIEPLRIDRLRDGRLRSETMVL